MPHPVLVSLYDAAAQDYERTRVPRFRPFVKKLFQRYDTRPNSHILDAGCGTGLAATMIAPRVGHGGKVIGVDASARMLEIARSKANGFGFDQCEFRLGDLHALDFADESFDEVICSFALWGEPAHLFAEFHRVLKHGGVLVAQNWQRDRDTAIDRYREQLRAHQVSSGDAELEAIRQVFAQEGGFWDQFKTPADYENVLNAGGFSDVRTYVEATPIHFDRIDSYIEWQSLGVLHRAELAAMADDQRADFENAVRNSLHSLETPKGLDVELRAIQLVARK